MAANDDLLAAVKAGEAARVRALLEDDPALAGSRDASGVSLVLLALYHQRRETAAALLDAWAADGFFPLGLACFFRQAEAAQVLLEAGADVRAAARNPMRVTALHAAAAARQAPLVKLLLDHGADANARQQASYTALHAAAQHGDVEMAELLLARGADPWLRSDDGKDAAAHARAGGHHALADRLASARP
jgi:uncharacterized protein